MENNENMAEPGTPELLGMNLDYDGGNTLQEAVRWSKFLSIASIVGSGLLLLLVAIAGPIFIALYGEELPDAAGVVGVAVVLAGAYLAATITAAIFLLRFTSQTRRGIESQDQHLFNRGLKSLKMYFLIVGILSVLMMGVYIYNLFNQF